MNTVERLRVPDPKVGRTDDAHAVVEVLVECTVETWELTQAQKEYISDRAIDESRHRGVSPDCAKVVTDLAAATDLLVHHIKRDRIPAVVRQPIPARRGVSLMTLLERGDTRAVLATCRDMFRFDRAQA